MLPIELIRGHSCLSVQEIPKEMYEGKRVLITGAAGSIGHVLYMKLKGMNVDVDGLDHDEHLVATMPKIQLSSYQNFQTYYAYELIFHAAAYKHVALGEKNIHSFMRNNGADVGELLRELERQKPQPSFVFVSTDKAAGESVLGRSKRLAERECEKYSFARSLRLVNCAFSHGSVLDLWSKGIRRLVNQDCQRYFMQLDEAANALLWMPFAAPGKYTIYGAPKFSIHQLANEYGGLFESIPIEDGAITDEKLMADNEILMETEYPWLRKISQ